ncbi:MAG: hypothetical protein G4V63_14335 [Candidatus Afipia apatlaquensis]|uniref:DUF4376 domain-containing protein n=1 Tax=Candidatus Afipia apatlaquensis TaxID=2712852 RepID=A0A7C9RFR1_9BRAD|nr:hypothetical protein [Candidatus Afipia apatlaquensis]
MKYILYDINTKAVVQWQDTDVYSYNEPTSTQSRVIVPEDAVPAAFDPYNWPSGWWYVDGALTQVAPPPPLSEVAMYKRWAVSARRAQAEEVGVVLDDNSTFAPVPAQMGRIASLALGHAFIGVTEVDIELGGEWRHFAAADLADAYAKYVRQREAFYAAERVHLEAIAVLLTAGDRPALEAYDTTAGWPAPEAP